MKIGLPFLVKDCVEHVPDSVVVRAQDIAAFVVATAQSSRMYCSRRKRKCRRAFLFVCRKVLMRRKMGKEVCKG